MDEFTFNGKSCKDFAMETVFKSVPDKLTISVPNKDEHRRDYTFIAKEVLQRAYTAKIGSTIDFCGAKMRITDVRITEGDIFLDLIHIPDEIIKMENNRIAMIEKQTENKKEKSL